jgi:hypothetical protein
MQMDAHVPRRSRPDPSRPGRPRSIPTASPRNGAEVCELTGWIDLHTWPAGTQAICRPEDAPSRCAAALH